MGRTVAIVTAAGSGERLGAGVPKAFVELAGRSLIECAVAGLRESGVVDAIVVAVPRDRVEAAETLLNSNNSPHVDVVVVAGGADRIESVRLALATACPDTEAVDGDTLVLVHDAARALTPSALFGRVVAALRSGHPAVVPGLPLADTIKAVDANGTVLGTPKRAGLRAVQTPQGFHAGVLRRAHDQAAGRDGSAADFTDDASMVEALGVPVQLVDGEVLAFKITTQLDLLLAQALVNR